MSDIALCLKSRSMVGKKSTSWICLNCPLRLAFNKSVLRGAWRSQRQYVELVAKSMANLFSYRLLCSVLFGLDWCKPCQRLSSNNGMSILKLSLFGIKHCNLGSQRDQLQCLWRSHVDLHICSTNAIEIFSSFLVGLLWWSQCWNLDNKRSNGIIFDKASLGKCAHTQCIPQHNGFGIFQSASHRSKRCKSRWDE